MTIGQFIEFMKGLIEALVEFFSGLFGGDEDSTTEAPAEIA